MQLPPCGMYLLTFDEFHWVAASDGHKFIDWIQLWGRPSAKLQEANLAEWEW